MNHGYQNSDLSAEQRADDLIEKMNIEEKCGQLAQVCMRDMDSKREIYEDGLRAGRWGSRILADTEWAGNNAEAEIDVRELNRLQKIAITESRWGIPLLFARDVIYGQRTVLPVPLAQAASWDPALIELAYRCIAKEAASQGIHWTFAPMMDIVRDPRWGRVIESCGEDPHLTSMVSEAMIKGFQGPDLSHPDSLLACAKHFCGYGFSEGGRDYDSTEISENTLHNVVLPPFKQAVKAGVATVMTGFNDLGGTPVSGHKKLIQGWLKEDQGFDGFVISDWGSIDDLERFGVAGSASDAAVLGCDSGIDMAMPSEVFDEHLLQAVQLGKISTQRLDDAAKRILTIKFKAGLFEHPYVDPERSANVCLSPAHRQTALALAESSMVLLKNTRGTLPLAKTGLKIAVVGPFTDVKRPHLGSWCLDGQQQDVVSIMEGLSNYAEQHQFFTAPNGLSDEMVMTAQQADVVIVCVGESHMRTGEARSIAHLGLPPGQDQLIEAIGKTGVPMVIVQCTGRPVPSEAIQRYASAHLYASHSGTETGTACARILFGEVSPSGKLPMSLPRCTGQIPIYYNRKPKAKAMAVPQYRAYIDEEESPLYPFGHGLTYSQFECTCPQVDIVETTGRSILRFSLQLINTGDREAAQVVQCYLANPKGQVTRPVKQLMTFTKVLLKPKERQELQLDIPVDDLSYVGPDGNVVALKGSLEFHVGTRLAAEHVVHIVID